MAGLSADADGDDIDDYSEPTVLFNLETGEGRRTLSWIWYTGSIKDSDVAADGSLHEGDKHFHVLCGCLVNSPFCL